MRVIYCVCALISVFIPLPCLSYAGSCQLSDQQTYASLNEPLRVAYAGEEAYLSGRAARTDDIHKFVINRISDTLDSRVATPDKIIAYLKCLQTMVPENSAAADATNLPVAFSLSDDGTKLAIGYDIYRGWGAVPDDRYYFDVFSKANTEWFLEGSTGSSFDGSTLFIYPIKAGKSGEQWFLFAGRLFGNTGGALHLEVVGYNGTSFRSVWQASDMKRTSLETVARDHVVISVEGTDKSGHYIQLRRRLKVAESGLIEVPQMQVTSDKSQ